MHMRVPEEEREKGVKRLFKEIMPENIPNLGGKVDIQIYEDRSFCVNFLNHRFPNLQFGVIEMLLFKNKTKQKTTFRKYVHNT